MFHSVIIEMPVKNDQQAIVKSFDSLAKQRQCELAVIFSLMSTEVILNEDARMWIAEKALEIQADYSTNKVII